MKFRKKTVKKTALMFLLAAVLLAMSGCQKVPAPSDTEMMSSSTDLSGTVSGIESAPVDTVSESVRNAAGAASDPAAPSGTEDAAASEPSEASSSAYAVPETDFDPSNGAEAPAESEHVHSYQSSVTRPSCTEDGITVYSCACGDSYQTSQPALGHDWGDWTVTKAAACTHAGERRAICKREGCGAVKTEAIAKLAHTWTGWQQSVAPTCTTDGRDIRHCAVCGFEDTRGTNKLGHSWGAWITDNAPTCTADGKRHHTCSRCNQTENDSIPKTGHSWGAWVTVTEPTCTATGTKQRTCSKCGDVETKSVDKAPHSFGAWTTTPATCTAPETKTRTCNVCGYVETQTSGGVGGHNWKLESHSAPTQSSAGYDLYECSVCHETKQEITHDQLYNMDQAMAAANNWLVSKGCVINYSLTPANGGYSPPDNPTHNYLKKYGGQSKLNAEAIKEAEAECNELVAAYGEDYMDGAKLRCYIAWIESTDEYMIYILRG